MQVKVKNSCELKRYVSQNIRTIRSNSWNCKVNKFGVLANLYSARLCCIYFSLIDKLLLNIVDRFQTTLILTDFYTIVAWFHTLFFTYVSCSVSYLTLLMANIKNRKKLQLIQTIRDVMLYLQHFTFHWKLLGLVSRIEKSGTGDNNFGKWRGTFLACVASVSNRVIARKLERKQKKRLKGSFVPLPLPRHYFFFFALVPAF